MTFFQKNPRLFKELRPLWPPWIAAVMAGSLLGLKPLANSEGLESLLTGIAAYGFFGGLALIAAIPFGSEFHERTLPLLLSQPINRSRLYQQKMFTLIFAIVAATITVSVLLTLISGWYPNSEMLEAVKSVFSGDELFLLSIFVPATVCSCGFWTLVAGSTIGGLVFSVVGQFLTTLAVAFITSRIHGEDQLFQDAHTSPAIIAAGLVYSAIFLYLGWRKFVRLEVRGVSSAGSAPNIAGFWPRKLQLRFLVSRPSGGALNLVRKELRLQKPIFQLAALFVLCWLATVALQYLRPQQNITYLFDALTFIYAPVASLLVGCISLGEEKAFGITASQLVLPFAPWRQWLIKLAVCAATVALLSLAVPILLFFVTGPFINLDGSGLMNSSDKGIAGLACISALMFLLGFWAVSLTANTVRAALLAMAGVIVLPSLAALGMYWGSLCVGVPPGGSQGGNQVGLILRDTAVGATVLLLGQSMLRFRRSEERESKVFMYSFTLAAITLFLSFWVTCFG